jgi:hypothetical protein
MRTIRARRDLDATRPGDTVFVADPAAIANTFASLATILGRAHLGDEVEQEWSLLKARAEQSTRGNGVIEWQIQRKESAMDAKAYVDKDQNDKVVRAIAALIREEEISIGDIYNYLGVDIGALDMDSPAHDVVSRIAGILEGWENPPPSY